MTPISPRNKALANIFAVMLCYLEVLSHDVAVRKCVESQSVRPIGMGRTNRGLQIPLWLSVNQYTFFVANHQCSGRFWEFLSRFLEEKPRAVIDLFELNHASHTRSSLLFRQGLI